MEDKLKKDIEAVVVTIFSKQEEAAKMQATEDALNEAASRIAVLDESVVAKSSEIEELTSSLADMTTTKDTELAESAALLETANTDRDAATAKLAEVETAFAELKKDILVKERLVELSEAKVAIKADLDSQIAKIKDMDDEEFSSYKTDRVELRESVMKELEATQTATDEAAVVAATEEVAVVGEEEVVVDGGVVTPQAEIKPDLSATAALNFESEVGSISKKYAELGKAMAASIKEGK